MPVGGLRGKEFLLFAEQSQYIVFRKSRMRLMYLRSVHIICDMYMCVCKTL